MKIIKILILILISLTISIKANSNEKLIDVLKEGGKLIFIRHAHAPGNGDPNFLNFKFINVVNQNLYIHIYLFNDFNKSKFNCNFR